MENQTNFADLFLTNQKQVVDAWNNYSQQLWQFTNKKEGSNNPFSDLLAKQQEMFQNLGGAGTGKKEQADVVAQWMQMQQDFYGEMFRFMGDPANKGKFPTDLLTESMKQWAELFDMARKQMGQAPDFSTMLKNSQQMAQTHEMMMKFWKPIEQMIKQNSFSPEALQKFFPQEIMMEMLSGLTGAKPMESMKEATALGNQFFTKWLSSIHDVNFQKIFQSPPFANAMPEMGNIDLNRLMQLSADLNNRFENTFAPFTYMLNAEKEMEVIDDLKNVQLDMMLYFIKAGELQMKMLEGGQEALPKAIQHFTAQYQQTQAMPDFEAFFGKYLELLEGDLLVTLASGSYAELQSQLVKAGLSVKSQMDNLKEVAFEGMPFTKRSETNDLVFEVQSIRRKIREVNQLVKNQKEEIAELKKAKDSPKEEELAKKMAAQEKAIAELLAKVEKLEKAQTTQAKPPAKKATTAKATTAPKATKPKADSKEA